MLEKLWKDIQYIYDEFNFSSRLMVDDLMIMSNDNYYQLYYQQDDTSTGIRIEKNYSVAQMWSDTSEFDIIDYIIYVEINRKIELDENYKIELSYKIITPFLREVKLNKIGV